ncbi:hypothetical protein [Acetobacter fallax]|uniref:Uncharacterized protein n=1 Tax=Acetobacter fallax TaxID=1737473 RepID=A0ABX0K899_9PROT|nr:hypothetical protein [Acetobacter fallax]NHO32584.1 hypothetical protein [Acetobacter fallax]NHO36071.1 hypothetical protein [Acetobacter fallax]
MTSELIVDSSDIDFTKIPATLKDGNKILKDINELGISHKIKYDDKIEKWIAILDGEEEEILYIVMKNPR